MDNLETNICDECESKFYQTKSEMSSLCPECANILYGYENCKHEFIDGRCLKCFWDNAVLPFILKQAIAKKESKSVPKNSKKIP